MQATYTPIIIYIYIIYYIKYTKHKSVESPALRHTPPTPNKKPIQTFVPKMRNTQMADGIDGAKFML